MELSDHGYEVLLQHLSPADTAALRLVSRSWQALVDRCLTSLHPFAVTTGFFSFSSTPSLVFRSPFRHSSVRHHPLDYGPSYALHAIAGQFTSLHTLSIDCSNKSCGDFEALPLMRQLRRLHLAQFNMADDAFEKGLGQCSSLEAMHLESQQAMLPMRSLRHLTELSRLNELALRPRGYIHVPPDSMDGVAALGELTGLTQLVMLTALKPPRHNAAGEASALAGPMPDHVPGPAGTNEGHPLYFSTAATQKLSNALGQLRSMKVLRLTGVSMLPPGVTRMTQLSELSLERVGHLDRPAVGSLCALKALTALTIITATDATADILHHTAAAAAQQQQQQAEAGGGEAVVAANAALGAPDAVAGTPTPTVSISASSALLSNGSQGLWLPLLELPLLQELVLGSAHRSQQLNLTGSLTAKLHSSGGIRVNSDNPSALPGLGGDGSCSSSGCSRVGHGGCSWYQQVNEAVSAYVCPTGAWSDLSNVKGLDSMVVVRSWHSAAVTAVFPTFADAVAAFMTWPLAPAAAPAAAAAAPTAASAADGQMAGWGGATRYHAPAMPSAAAMLISNSNTSSGSSGNGWGARDSVKVAAAGFGVFQNHPNQGCYISSLPQLTVLVFKPRLGRLGPQQKLSVMQLLQGAAGWRDVQLPGSQQHLQGRHQSMGSWRAHSDSVARCLLLAQLRSSMHHSKLLLVLGASATALTRLELTVDQSWPPTVLASLGQLDRLKRLTVLKLDCGRQQPVEEMWEGLSRLVGLRWLCLRWLDRLPVAHLAPLTSLVALQLKNIDKPPGVAQLAEVLHGMPHLTALAIEGALLDADEDWLRDMAGLMRHGRWTSSWVEHVLCREYRLRVLGSITAALLMSALLNSTKWPEMLFSAFLAAVAGAIFVMAVAASLLQILFDPHQARHGRMGLQQYWQYGNQQQGLQEPGCTAVPASEDLADIISSNRYWQHFGAFAKGYAAWAFSSLVQQVQIWLLGGWMVAAARSCSSWLHFAPAQERSSAAFGSYNSSTACGSSSSSSREGLLSFWLRFAAVRASFLKGVGPMQQDTAAVTRNAALAATHALDGSASSSSSTPGQVAAQSVPSAAAAAAATAGGGVIDGAAETARSSCASKGATADPAAAASSSSSTISTISDPGSAFRRLRFLSLRRCTLSHSNNSVSNKLWQLSVLASQLAPGLGSQLVAVALALVLWPLAVAAAISRIAATSSSLYGGSDGAGLSSSSGNYSYNRHSKFSAWAWGWDLVCGLLQGAANRVEGAAAGCGPVVAVASCMPELRYLDLTWLNLEPWELHSIVQMQQLHYLGLSRQQVGVVMSREAVFARNCIQHRGQRGLGRCHGAAAAAAAGVGGDGQGLMRTVSSRGIVGWTFSTLWMLVSGPLLLWRGLWGGANSGRQQRQGQQHAVGVVGVSGVDLIGLCDDNPSLMLIESPSGFDEVIEREFAAM